MELDIFQNMYHKAAESMENTEGYVAECYFNFVDVGVYNISRRVARPNWINVIREPISRYVSHFYYMARDWRMQNKVLSPEDAKVNHGLLKKHVPLLDLHWPCHSGPE